MQTRKRLGIRHAFSAGTGCLAALFGAFASQPVHAQSPSGERIAKTALGFLSTGGYFITGSARHAIGTSKFYNEAAYFARPKHIGGLLIAGGAEIIGAQDHFFPFQGGDQFNLIGPAVRITTEKTYSGVRPFLAAGLFYGELRSEQLGFDRSAFTPSLAVGADWKFSRYFSLTAAYRVAQDINGFSPDGFSVYLRIF